MSPSQGRPAKEVSSMAQRQESEDRRLQEARELGIPWKKWGPYLSERQWGTVREDYSPSGDAWNYFSHDQARSRAYRWGEDGLAGVCDDQQRLCFALALWNGADTILKERLYGLTNTEGNHGEDVKEYYFYLDSTPTHSYMKYLYKYPQRAYPYVDLIQTNQQRGRDAMEYELIDTGVFDDDRYFDIVVEYAKSGPEELLIKISAWNRGPKAATLHVLPTLWFRNTWSWSATPPPRPVIRQLDPQTIIASDSLLGDRYLRADRAVPWLFTENETNNERIFRTANASPYVKDGINETIVGGKPGTVNPDRAGTKAAAHYELNVPGQAVAVLRLRLAPQPPSPGSGVGQDFEEVLAARLHEADAFYADVIPAEVSADGRSVMRQAFAGMLWSKQFYY